MYCIEKLKLNKAVNVPVGRSVDLFRAVGSRVAPQNLYSGENEVPRDMNKVDELASTEADLLREYDAKMAEEAKKK